MDELVHQVVPQVRRHRVVPVFRTLHGRGNHLICGEVSSGTARIRAASSRLLLLTAVLIEQHVPRQWNDVLRLVLLLLLLLQLSVWLLLLLLLLEGSGHLAYTLVGSARLAGNDGKPSGAGSTNTGSVTGGEYVVDHHLVGRNHHPDTAGTLLLLLLRLVSSETRHLSLHGHLTGLLLLAGHAGLAHLLLLLLVSHLGVAGQGVGRGRGRTLHLVAAAAVLVERTGHLLLLARLTLLLILAGLTWLLLLLRLVRVLLQLVFELVLLVLLLLLILLLLSGLLLVLFVLVGIAQRQTNRTVLPLAVLPVVDDLPGRGAVGFGAVFTQLAGLHVGEDLLHRPTVGQGTIVTVGILRLAPLALVGVKQQDELLLDEFSFFRIG